MIFGATRSVPHRGVLVLGVGLLLLSTFVAAPVFTQRGAAESAFGSPAFGALWSSIEPVVPNFWGQVVQPARQEPYREAPNGTRLVQYFDKARMEQTTASGPVTNGLLTVELITGQRQMGDTSFAAFSPSTLPVVGDPTNAWPPYAALGGGVFAAKVGKSGEPFGAVYKPDGAFGLNPGLAADPGAQYGTYQSDPGGKYGHNIPAAFSSYLAALPIPWLPAMGLPLTEPFWVNVRVGGTPTWVLVQPYERRVLSYTPSNPTGFRVEMGNIGQHYSRWRYGDDTIAGDTATPTVAATSNAATIATMTVTTTATPTTTTVVASGTPRPLAIASVQLGTVTESAFSLTFKTSVPATTEILYGTASHSYTSRQDVSTTATQDHAANLTDLQAGTKYYFALHATTGGDSAQSRESFFTTASTVAAASTATPLSATATKTSRPPTASPTDTPLPTPTATPRPSSPTTTTLAKNVRLNITQVKVDANNPARIAPVPPYYSGIPIALIENTTILLALSYDGSLNGVTNTINVPTWTRDMANGSATGVGPAAPLLLIDRQTAMTLTATATIPFTDSTNPPIVVTFSRKVLPSEYGNGITITSPPLSNARAPGFSVTLTFSVALVG